MATSYQYTRAGILDTLDAERWQAQQASREQARRILQANALEHAGDLARKGRLQESKRVLELNYFNQED